MTKGKGTVHVGILVMLVMLLSTAHATNSASFQAAAVATSAATNDQITELYVYDWANDLPPDVIADFEQLYHAKIKLATYRTYDEWGDNCPDAFCGDPMPPSAQRGDVIVLQDRSSAMQVWKDYLEPLDFSKLPNFTKNVAKWLLTIPNEPGQSYSLPYEWYTYGIWYSMSRVGHPITSWGDLFDPSLKGRVSLLYNGLYGPEPWSSFMVYLGKNPSSTNPKDWDALQTFLLRHADNVVWFHKISSEAGQLKLGRGDLDAITDWSRDSFLVRGLPSNDDLQYVIPKEGTQLWMDRIGIIKDAPHKALAFKFLNYLYDPGVAARIANYTHVATVNQTAIDQGLVDKALLANPNLYPPVSLRAKLNRFYGALVGYMDTTAWANFVDAVCSVYGSRQQYQCTNADEPTATPNAVASPTPGQ